MREKTRAQAAARAAPGETLPAAVGAGMLRRRPPTPVHRPDAGAGADPLTDPLAGMGPMGMGGMGGDPLSSLAGLGSALPGMLGGLGAGGSPLDSLGGALGGLGSALPGLASQFSDKNGQDPASTDDKFSDTKGDGKADKPEDAFKDDQGKTDDRPADKGREDAKSPADPNTVQPVASTPAAAVPAAAPSVDGHTVSLPDGTSVSAPDDLRKNAMEAVIDGKSVSDAYGGQIPPAGSPVMNPVDRNSLRPRRLCPVRGQARGDVHGQWQNLARRPAQTRLGAA